MLISQNILTIFSSLRVFKIPQGGGEEKGIELIWVLLLFVILEFPKNSLFSIIKSGHIGKLWWGGIFDSLWKLTQAKEVWQWRRESKWRCLSSQDKFRHWSFPRGQTLLRHPELTDSSAVEMNVQEGTWIRKDSSGDNEETMRDRTTTFTPSRGNEWMVPKWASFPFWHGSFRFFWLQGWL